MSSRQALRKAILLYDRLATGEYLLYDKGRYEFFSTSNTADAARDVAEALRRAHRRLT